MTDALIITDGRAGNLRQARALASAIGAHGAEVEARLRTPWAQLAPHLPHMATLAQRGAQRLPDRPPWPALVIGCGRQAAWATRWLKRQAGAASFCVQILDPRIDSRHWDLLIAPRHDGLRGDNVLQPIGSLNPVDSAWLARARAAFPHLAELPQPRVTLLLGGPRRGVRFDDSLRHALLAGALAQSAATGSVLLCASPRTPPGFARALRDALGARAALAWLDEGDGENPYPGCLAWADRIIVSPDSVNMLSEAAACGVPVSTLGDSGLPERLGRFHQALRQGGWLHDLESQAGDPAEPLRETSALAEQVRQRMQAHVATHALVVTR